MLSWYLSCCFVGFACCSVDYKLPLETGVIFPTYLWPADLLFCGCACCASDSMPSKQLRKPPHQKPLYVDCKRNAVCALPPVCADCKLSKLPLCPVARPSKLPHYPESLEQGLTRYSSALKVRVTVIS
jgi:hypothetical protein